MSIEIIFTSAPKGIRAGRSGYVTVGMTSGAPEPLIDRLESLSGYRHLFQVGSPDWERNPHAFAHWRISVGGQGYGVLSHVFATVDHQSRQSKFAHHLALDAGEMPPAGPAWLMLQRGVMEHGWSGEPRLLPSGKHLPSVGPSPRRCEAWEKASGDAGWAGALAEAFLLDGTKVSYVIYEPGMDVLPLMHEAIALLPEGRRWQVTFNTYHTEVPAGLSCVWRCCAAGSPAAAAARSNATSGLVIDLRARSQVTRESKYVQFARTGAGDLHSSSHAGDASPRGGVPGLAGAGQRGLEDGPLEILEDSDRVKAHPFSAREPVARRGASAPLFAVAIVWPLLVLGGGWLALRPREPPRSHEQELARKDEELEKLGRELEREKARAEKAEKRATEAARRATDADQRAEDAARRAAEAERQAADAAEREERQWRARSEVPTPVAAAPAPPPSAPPRPSPGQPGPAPSAGESAAAGAAGEPAAESVEASRIAERHFAVKVRVPEAQDAAERPPLRLRQIPDARRVTIEFAVLAPERFEVEGAESGFTLRYVKKVLGGTKSVVVARVTVKGEEISWSWGRTDEWPDDLRPALRGLLPGAALLVERGAGGEVARVQLSEPVRVPSKLEREFATVPDVPSGCDPRLELARPPDGWEVDAEAEGAGDARVFLKSKHGARFGLTLAAEKELRIGLTWITERTQIARKHVDAREQRDKAAKAHEKAEKAEKSLADLVEALKATRRNLPKLKDRDNRPTAEVDWDQEEKLKDPKDFRKFRASLDAIRKLDPDGADIDSPRTPAAADLEEYMAEVKERVANRKGNAAAALAEAARAEQEAKARLEDLDRLESLEVRIVAGRSRAIVALVSFAGRGTPERR